MNQNLQMQAIKLAEQPYSVEVLLDETTEGQPIYVARVPELEGCMAQGETIEQALESLTEAKIDYIQSLLDDGLPVPAPALRATTTSSSYSATFTLSNRPGKKQENLSRVYEATFLPA